MSKKKTDQKLAMYNTLKEQFQSIAMQVFEWSGLPEEVESRHIEKQLFEFGLVGFAKAPTVGYVALRAQDIGGVNIYGEGVKYQLIGYNGFNFVGLVKGKNLTLIRNNETKTPTITMINSKLEKMVDIDQTLDLNLIAHKTPLIFRGNRKQLETMVRKYRNIIANEPFIFEDEAAPMDEQAKAEAPKVQYICDKLKMLYHAYEYDILTILGINNSVVEKKERVQSAEVEANDEFIRRNLESMLATRKRAAKKISELFGLTVTVDFKQVEEQIEMPEENENEEDFDNEQEN